MELALTGAGWGAPYGAGEPGGGGQTGGGVLIH